MTFIGPTAIIVFAACMAFAPASHAQEEVIERIDAQGLRALVAGLGHEITTETISETGQPVVAASDGQVNYLVAGTVCEDGQCQGMLSELVFTDTPVTLEVVNQVNQNYAAIKIVAMDDDSVVFSRYDVINGGTTLGALSTSVVTLLEISRLIVRGNEE